MEADAQSLNVPSAEKHMALRATCPTYRSRAPKADPPVTGPKSQHRGWRRYDGDWRRKFAQCCSLSTYTTVLRRTALNTVLIRQPLVLKRAVHRRRRSLQYPYLCSTVPVDEFNSVKDSGNRDVTETIAISTPTKCWKRSTPAMIFRKCGRTGGSCGRSSDNSYAAGRSTCNMYRCRPHG